MLAAFILSALLGKANSSRIRKVAALKCTFLVEVIIREYRGNTYPRLHIVSWIFIDVLIDLLSNIKPLSFYVEGNFGLYYFDCHSNLGRWLGRKRPKLSAHQIMSCSCVRECNAAFQALKLETANHTNDLFWIQNIHPSFHPIELFTYFCLFMKTEGGLNHFSTTRKGCLR